uniref:Uncharacterized protein n=1 Tax=uncultured Elusimicrobia bacterium TaxID=699876 RepID=A0A650ELX4_9BACT|nr:hypothetical protein Elusimicrob1349_1030 [uncultured Elusimicrobia bacterium]
MINSAQIGIIGMCGVFAGPMTPASPMSANFYTTDSTHQNKPFADGNDSFNTIDTIQQDKNFIQFELTEVKKDFSLENGFELANGTINNAKVFLDNIVNEHIMVPHIAANAMGQVGLTWDSLTHRIYLTIDENGELCLTLVNRNNLNECDSMQRNIGIRDEIIRKIKTAL